MAETLTVLEAGEAVNRLNSYAAELGLTAVVTGFGKGGGWTLGVFDGQSEPFLSSDPQEVRRYLENQPRHKR